MALPDTKRIRHLHELIAALDRRVPQAHRAGEASITRDAATLKTKALARIEELERHDGRDPLTLNSRAAQDEGLTGERER